MFCNIIGNSAEKDRLRERHNVIILRPYFLGGRESHDAVLRHCELLTHNSAADTDRSSANFGLEREKHCTEVSARVAVRAKSPCSSAISPGAVRRCDGASECKRPELLSYPIGPQGEDMYALRRIFRNAKPGGRTQEVHGLTA